MNTSTVNLRKAIQKAKADELNAVLQVFASAKRAGRPWPRLVAAGQPYLAKDNIVTKEGRTTAGSLILKDFKSLEDATVITKLRKAGAVLIGKTNLDEFAMGSSTENSAFGVTRNPFDKSRVAGGSSGGSAAAVAANIVPFALGSDTGGSIRQPAAFCGVVGLKPTYGRVSRYGLIAMASSLDQIGPLAKTTEEVAQILEIIAGRDEKDETTSDKPKDFKKDLKKGAKGLKIGMVKEFFTQGLDPKIKKIILEKVSQLKKEGAKIVEVSLPLAKEALAIYYLIQPAETSANLARYDGVRYGLSARGQFKTVDEMYKATRTAGFGKEVKRRIILGTFTLAEGYQDEYYLKACAARAALTAQVEQVFKKVNLLLSPTTPTVAFKIGEKKDPLAMYLSDIYTVLANLTGIPAISVPVGFVGHLPVGLQLMAKKWDEKTLLRGAYAVEKLSN
jgi:aspartyl-tRNA(Asn)/glutamyl-tRNA(Gln) amidotransferase subunit A